MKGTVISLLALLASVSALGQEAQGQDMLRYPLGAVVASPRTFGTSQDSLQRLGFQAFAPIDSGTSYSFSVAGGYRRFATTPGNKTFSAHPVLPSGALLLGVEFAVCDSDPATDPFVSVIATDNLGGNLQVLGSVATAGTPGCAPVFVDLTAGNFIVDNAANQIALEVVLKTGDETHAFAGATVFYRLQVSPAPAIPSFNDVPDTHPFYQFIEALKSSGITGGCQAAPPLYCPESFVTRGQMAVFLAKGLGLQFP